MKKIFLTSLAVFLFACSQNEGSQTTNLSAETAKPEEEAKAPNFLVIIGDDMGQETLGCYGVGDSPAHTPTLNTLCNQGVRFDNFWTQPTCSPTRATILTGEYGFKSGVQTSTWPNVELAVEVPLPTDEDPTEYTVMGHFDQLFDILPPPVHEGFRKAIQESRGLKTDAVTLAHRLKQSEHNYATGAFGKWHLADSTNGGVDHPQLAGFDKFSGTMDGQIRSYFVWHHVDNGEESQRKGYFTSHIVEEAVGWINQQEQPWLAWMAFIDPHEPWHKPPKDALRTEASKNLDPDAISEDNLRPYYLAQLETLDVHIERLLRGIRPEDRDNTYIIFLGDNGSPKQVAIAPYGEDKAKMTLYEGGVNSPLFINGPNVATGTANQLTNSTDLFASILELAGINDDIPDHSVSLNSYLRDTSAQQQRDYIFADALLGIGPTETEAFAIRNQQYKYINTGKEEFFFDLSEDPYENTNLIENSLSAEQQTELEQLKAAANDLKES